MKILILGAGQVGSSLAEKLANEDHEITVVDSNNIKLQELSQKIDIKTVQGFASLPVVLNKAGANEADLLIAVSDVDEVNMIACQVAWTIFKTPTKIARIRNDKYISRKDLFSNDSIPIDFIINPALIVAQNIAKLVQFPGSLQIIDFVKIKSYFIVASNVDYGGSLVGQKVLDQSVKVLIIFRRMKIVIPNKDTLFEIDDELFFLANKKDILHFISQLKYSDKPISNIIIAGGGNVAKLLVDNLDGKYNLKLIEKDKERSVELSHILDDVLILNGSVSDRDLLIEENVGNSDIWIALTNEDEINLASSMLARSLGVKKIFTLINNVGYLNLLKDQFDILIHPQILVVGRILSYMRKDNIVNIASFYNDKAEMLEIIVTEEHNKIIGISLSLLKLPKTIILDAFIRKDSIIIDQEELIQKSDVLIVILLDKLLRDKLESYFKN